MATLWKPDPSRGVFETMLVVRGEPVALPAHLARIEASLEVLYGAGLPAPAARRIPEQAASLELGRLRLTVAPGESAGLAFEVEAGPLDPSLHFPPDPVSLRSHPVAGGLGCHKWVDRAAIPPRPAGEAPLLVDGGEVLEAGWANVFAVRGGTLFTPPLDGRILPGVTRATVSELARAERLETIERPLSLQDLRGAEEVFLTNSIRGIESVGSVDGSPIPGERNLTALLSSALRSRWGLAKPAPAPAS
ncbi:MAG TPA: aminotransferase class IV [Solirubrobacterales bacterium]|nr:aminotransferase class IV [Solirubrobacterales bacterium]